MNSVGQFRIGSLPDLRAPLTSSGCSSSRVPLESRPGACIGAGHSARFCSSTEIETDEVCPGGDRAGLFVWQWDRSRFRRWVLTKQHDLQPCGRCMAPAPLCGWSIVSGLYFSMGRASEPCISVWSRLGKTIALPMTQGAARPKFRRRASGRSTRPGLVIFPAINKLTSVRGAGTRACRPPL
jgi:hypothetical protein